MKAIIITFILSLFIFTSDAFTGKEEIARIHFDNQTTLEIRAMDILATTREQAPGLYDAELGMVYYNFRFYNPVDGRWISRDPIGEEDEINMYGFVGNNPSWLLDQQGLFECNKNTVGQKGDFNLSVSLINMTGNPISVTVSPDIIANVTETALGEGIGYAASKSVQETLEGLYQSSKSTYGKLSNTGILSTNLIFNKVRVKIEANMCCHKLIECTKRTKQGKLIRTKRWQYVKVPISAHEERDIYVSLTLNNQAEELQELADQLALAAENVAEELKNETCDDHE